MLPLNKLYDPADFLADPVLTIFTAELHRTEDILKQLGNCPDVPVAGRYWEYGQGLRASQYAGSHTGKGKALEVGGSDSLFLPTLIRENRYSEYTAVELPEWISAWGERKQAQCSKPIRQLPEIPAEQFDFVACISVIEHVKDPLDFIEKMGKCVAPGGILFLTSDIGEHERDDYMFSHMRSMEIGGKRQIWTPETWRWAGQEPGFEFVGPVDFKWNGPNIYGSYSFASMALQKAR